jgi:hypothetical protein
MFDSFAEVFMFTFIVNHRWLSPLVQEKSLLCVAPIMVAYRQIFTILQTIKNLENFQIQPQQIGNFNS